MPETKGKSIEEIQRGFNESAIVFGRKVSPKASTKFWKKQKKSKYISSIVENKKNKRKKEREIKITQIHIYTIFKNKQANKQKLGYEILK